ncbi:hypothetical protein ACJRO7_034677 [Eucalyptus globulus]|uniref:Serine/threonine-protein phosphatase 2A activator n=1 Tax=Eucalyptus globulus TaxID=34317 RepID=A0ABD3J6U9_EUCGL
MYNRLAASNPFSGLNHRHFRFTNIHAGKSPPFTLPTSSTGCAAAGAASEHSGTTSARCGRPTSYPSPPPPFSGVSPPPTYRPIRAAASVSVLSATSDHSGTSPSSPDDTRRFHGSDVSENFLGVVVALSASVPGHKISDSCHESSTVSAIASIVETPARRIEEIPPAQQAESYGNVSCRSWRERLVQNSESLMLTFLPADLRSATVDTVPEITESFGNSSRIDYRHLALDQFCCMVYLELMRKIAVGVFFGACWFPWCLGLGDYYFSPFIFGPSQLIGHKYTKPKSIFNEDILENFSNEYIYFILCE